MIFLSISRLWVLAICWQCMIACHTKLKGRRSNNSLGLEESKIEQNPGSESEKSKDLGESADLTQPEKLEYNRVRNTLRVKEPSVKTRTFSVQVRTTYRQQQASSQVKATINMLWLVDHNSSSMHNDMPTVAQGLVDFVQAVQTTMTHLNPKITLLSRYYGRDHSYLLMGTPTVPATPATQDRTVHIPARPAKSEAKIRAQYQRYIDMYTRMIKNAKIENPYADTTSNEDMLNYWQKKLAQCCRSQDLQAQPARTITIKGRPGKPGRPAQPPSAYNKRLHNELTTMVSKLKAAGIRLMNVAVDSRAALTVAQHSFDTAGFHKQHNNIVVVVTDDCDRLTAAAFQQALTNYRDPSRRDSVGFFGFIDKAMDTIGRTDKALCPEKNTYANIARNLGGQIFDVLSMREDQHKPTMSWSTAFSSLKSYMHTINTLVQVPVNSPIKVFPLGKVKKILSVKHGQVLLNPSQYLYDQASSLTINSHLRQGDQITVEYEEI